MKIILRFAAFAGLMLVVSCGKDTANVIADVFDEETEELESTVLDIDLVTDNVLISGGTKMEGRPPAFNGNISLDLANSGKTALLDEGFDISLNSDGEITGAYIQFKSKDGEVSDSYYDVNLETNNSGKAGKSMRRRVAREKAPRIANKTNETNLDIDFNVKIEPGEFCYEICVYDAEGNISEPQEVCLKVETWGGNSAAVGKWKLDKWFYDYNAERVFLEGIDNCIQETNGMYCSSIFIEDIESEDCVLAEYWDIELKADGTYVEKEKIIWTETYSDISQNPCLEEALSQDIYTFESTGKWSYVDSEDKFIFITYYDEEIYNGESNSYTAEPGEGGIYYGAGGYDGEVTITAESFVVESYEETTVHFKK